MVVVDADGFHCFDSLDWGGGGDVQEEDTRGEIKLDYCGGFGECCGRR